MRKFIQYKRSEGWGLPAWGGGGRRRREEEEEGLFKADAVNWEEDSERDRANLV